MRELVEQEPCQLRVRVVDERREQRVVEPAQRGVRRHAVDYDVIARGAPRRRVALGILPVVVAAVRHAAGDRKAGERRLERKLRRRHHVP